MNRKIALSNRSFLAGLTTATLLTVGILSLFVFRTQRAFAQTPPTVTLSGSATVNEGDAVHYSYTTQDPDPDTFSLADASCGTGGSLDNSTFDTGTGAGSFDCTFPNGPATPTVSVTVSDGTESGSDSINVTVSNVAPTLSFGSSATANEGQTLTYSYTTDDPGTETFSLDTETCGTGGVLSGSSFTPSTGAGSFDCTFPDGPASSTVSVTVSDGTDSDSDSINVTVSNVAPAVSLSGNTSANEGQTLTYSYTTSDPGTETFALSNETCGTGGTLSDSNFDSGTGEGSFKCTFPDGPASPTVSVTVSDGTDSDSDSINVTVSNVSPAVSLSGSATANEGQTITYSYTTDDPDPDTFSLITETCGTGGSLTNSFFEPSTGAGSFDCTFPNGPATPTVSVTVSDGTESGSDSINVTVSNVAPAVSLSGSATANEGQTLTYGYTTSDPGTETFSLDTETCGTGGVLSGSSFTPSTGAGSFNCTFPDGPASSTVSVTVSDGTVSDSDSINVTVSNVSPAVSLSGSATANEGQTLTYSYTTEDPGTETFSLDTETCGTGGTLSDSNFESGTGEGSFKCTFPDGLASPTVSVTISDDTAPGSDSINVIVSNVAPLVNAGPDGSIAEGGTFTGSGSFTDPGVDTWTASVNYGDGSGTNPLSLSGKNFNLSHTYADIGEYTITVTVADSDGASGNDTVKVTVSNVGPIAANDQYEVEEDDVLSVPAPIGVLSNDTDPGTSSLTAIKVSNPLSGTLSLSSNGSFTYTPNPNFNGIDSFTYQANDGNDLSNIATVTITVTPSNDPPQAQDDIYSVMAGETLSKPSGEGVLANDLDVDGDTLTAQQLSDPDSGSVILQPDGSFTYTPEIGFTGVVTFTYQASDGIATDTGHVVIEVFDGSEPRVEFTGPVASGDTLDVYNEIVCLKAFAEDDISIDRVRFYWWNPVAEQYFDLSIDHDPPFEACIDTTAFPQGFNQVFAKSYDESGNESARKWIWLYKVADLWRSLLPVVGG